MALGSHLITVRRLKKYIDDVIGKKANLPDTSKTIIGNISQINTDLTWKKLGNYSGNATFSLPSNFQELYIQVRNDANEWRASTVILEDTIDGSTTTYIGFGSAKMFASAYMTKTTGKINTVEWEGTATSNYTVFVYYR